MALLVYAKDMIVNYDLGVDYKSNSFQIYCFVIKYMPYSSSSTHQAQNPQRIMPKLHIKCITEKHQSP